MTDNLTKYNAEIVTTAKLDYDDFERLVEDHYGTNPEFVATEEANNYSEYEFDYSTYPEKCHDFVCEDKEAVQNRIRKGDFKGVGIGQIFTTLIDDKIIPPANYTIVVSW